MSKIQTDPKPLYEGAPILPSEKPKEADALPQYGITHQGIATNIITKIKPSTSSNITIDMFGNATIKEHGMTLLISGFNDLINKIGVSTKKLLDAFTMTLTKSGSQSSLVRLSLDEYMNMCHLKDKKEARRQINLDMEALSRLKLSWNEKEKGGRSKDFLDVFVFGGEKGIRNGTIYFSFSQTFFDILRRYPTMPYHRALFQVNPKYNPNSYNLGRRILEHKRINAGKKNENRIAVATLLKICLDIPRYDEVMKTDRAVTRRIIERFNRDLDALESIFTWEYSHRNEVQLSEEELRDFSYSSFISCLINVHWNEYPDQTNIIEARSVKNKTTAARKRKIST
jgi:hypothetical protein